jgi:hypothetical protein
MKLLHLFLASLLLAAPLSARVWTNQAGKTIEGELVRIDSGGKVVLK